MSFCGLGLIIMILFSANLKLMVHVKLLTIQSHVVEPTSYVDLQLGPFLSMADCEPNFLISQVESKVPIKRSSRPILASEDIADTNARHIEP